VSYAALLERILTSTTQRVRCGIPSHRANPYTVPQQENEVLVAAVEECLSLIRPREADVLRRRHGLPPYDREYSLALIGRESKRPVSPTRIQQVEALALRKLRHSTRTRVLERWYRVAAATCRALERGT